MFPCSFAAIRQQARSSVKKKQRELPAAVSSLQVSFNLFTFGCNNIIHAYNDQYNISRLTHGFVSTFEDDLFTK